MGGQPRGMERNLGKTSCQLCPLMANDNPQHVMFECVELKICRDKSWPLVIRSMPRGMAREIETMNAKEATAFVLAGFRCPFIPEWTEVYEKLALFVFNMYLVRCKKYDEIEGV